METLIETLIKFSYILSIVFLTATVLTLIVKGTNIDSYNDKRRMIISFICGLILAPIWVIYGEMTIPTVIVECLAAMTFYKIIKLFIWDGWEKLYNSVKGILKI